MVSPRSRKLELTPGVPVADCGTTRYSAVSTLALAGKSTHPESGTGSTGMNESTARETVNPLPAVHSGRSGGGFGAVLSLHAAASSSDAVPTHLSAARNMVSFRRWLRPHQRQPRADRAHDLVHSNHRDNQGLERDPPLGERPVGGGGQAQRDASLRDKYQPPIAGYGGRHIGVPSCPAQPVAQTPHTQAHQQQDPPHPEILQRSNL